MCCKCCQSCLESIYWHCIEKHFCYDESIALYEDEESKVDKKDEKYNNAFDNLAFYDSVATIANRAIFCIEPLPEKPLPVITQQPLRKARWWESNDDDPKCRQLINNIASVTNETEVDKVPIKPCMSTPCYNKDHANPMDAAPTEAKPYEKKKKTCFQLPLITETVDSKSSGLDTITEGETYSKISAYTLPTPAVKLRKKSLHERRMSKSLTLNLEKLELPIIRQSSFPKFYLDTPEANQADSTIAPTPIQAFETPMPRNAQFIFDLKSVVQIANERSKMQQESASGKENNRLGQIKDKLRMMRISSSGNLHGKG